MATEISDFYVGTTHAFSLLLKINNVAQDITGDTVTLRMKERSVDTDENAKLTSVADVATDGADGIAYFTIDPDDTKDLTPKQYYLDVEWITSTSKEYIPLNQTITLLPRVSDVPA